ncbi:MAG: Uncharacterised protein [SAR116 cluster bacterium]|nr:MAG: Uncharacterised protein [SAR116 cluster bacterium]
MALRVLKLLMMMMKMGNSAITVYAASAPCARRTFGSVWRTRRILCRRLLELIARHAHLNAEEIDAHPGQNDQEHDHCHS